MQTGNVCITNRSAALTYTNLNKLKALFLKHRMIEYAFHIRRQTVET